MKKIFLLFAIAASSLTAFAGEKDIDPKVLKSFKGEFAAAREVTWTATGDYYKAEFIFNEQHVTAYYGIDGELMGLSRHITSFDLPLNLQADIKKSYSEYWITDLIEVTKSNSTTYYITIEDADTQFVLKASGGESWTEYKKVKKI
jgi:hypothetical protein